MDLKFVESFLLVLQEGSIAGAARKQNITPAAVSQRITALQDELGVALLAREGRRMTATSDGRALVPMMQDMLSRRRDIERVLSSNELIGSFRFGAISTALAEYGSELAKNLRSKAPGMMLQFVPGTSEGLYERLSKGRIDMAILAAPPFDLPKSMRFDLLAAQEIGVFRRTTADLAEPFIVYDRHSWGGHACWTSWTETRPEPEVLCELDAPEVIAQMVAQGLGQAVLPRWAGLNVEDGVTEFVPIGAVRQIGLVSWQRDRKSVLMTLIRAALGIG